VVCVWMIPVGLKRIGFPMITFEKVLEGHDFHTLNSWQLERIGFPIKSAWESWLLYIEFATIKKKKEIYYSKEKKWRKEMVQVERQTIKVT